MLNENNELASNEYSDEIIIDGHLIPQEENLLTSPDKFVPELFRETPDDITIRPSLKSNDIRLIRRMAIALSTMNQGNDRRDCVDLYRRMLRKVR